MRCLKGFLRTPISFRVLFFSAILLLSQNASASTISGIVYDKQRNALAEVDVELLDDLYRQYGRTRTDGAGRYQFGGLSDGNWTIRVLPFRYDLVDQSQNVEIKTLTVTGQGNGNAFMNLDFYLLPRKGSLADSEIGVVFAQEVSPNAKKLYEKALEDLAKKRTNEGILGLNEAVQAFPEYYLALHRLGKELFIKGKYLESAQSFMQAIKVNPKSATSFYYLGYALSNLGKEYNKSAIAALNQAYTLAPASTQVLYILGKIERQEGNYEAAEKHLVQAKKLTKVAIPEIHKELAQLYSDNLKKYSEAADELELYLKASNLKDTDEKNLKKVIIGLREKAKSQ